MFLSAETPPIVTLWFTALIFNWPPSLTVKAPFLSWNVLNPFILVSLNVSVWLFEITIPFLS